MMNDIIGFIQSFDNQKLNINVNSDIIQFKKHNKLYSVKISIHDNNIKFHNINNINNINNTTDEIHFVEIINKCNLNNINQLPDLMEFIAELNVNHYCVVCHTKLDFQSNTLIPCENLKCIYDYEELIINNSVTEKFSEDVDKCVFLIESAIDAMTCNRKYDIFEPFPKHFMKYEIDAFERGTLSKLTGKNYDNGKNFELIDKTINELNTIGLHNLESLICKCKTDAKLAEKIGKDLYILIRFILMSCKVDIVKNDDMLGIKGDKFKIYKIIHSIDKEEEFKQISSNTNFLFHGSRWCNWYSILRNGLKNCSKTKLMTAGAAYGDGIYLSDDINLSFGYGLSGSKSIVGVFEVVDKQKYHKGGVVYVVDDEKVLIQRYLLIIPSLHKETFLKNINTIFNKTIYEEKINATAKYNKKSIAKIIREYKILSKLNPETSSFRIDVNPNYPFEWKIFIGKFDEKYPIAQDMKQFNIKEIELEVKFPENYPFSPLFIRVVSPRFARLTAHITTEGSFCNELLTEQGWRPTYTVESVVVSLISEIIEGGGRIDPKMYNIPYSYEAAKKDFIRVAKSHGWM